MPTLAEVQARNAADAAAQAQARAQSQQGVAAATAQQQSNPAYQAAIANRNAQESAGPYSFGNVSASLAAQNPNRSSFTPTTPINGNQPRTNYWMNPDGSNGTPTTTMQPQQANTRPMQTMPLTASSTDANQWAQRNGIDLGASGPLTGVGGQQASTRPMPASGMPQQASTMPMPAAGDTNDYGGMVDLGGGGSGSMFPTSQTYDPNSQMGGSVANSDPTGGLFAQPPNLNFGGGMDFMNGNPQAIIAALRNRNKQGGGGMVPQPVNTMPGGVQQASPLSLF